MSQRVHPLLPPIVGDMPGFSNGWTQLIALLAILFTAAPLRAQDSTSIDLRGLAAFRIGDDNTWRSKYIDEREGWNFIPVPCAWERAGFPLHDGIAWYRIRFRIPKAIRNDSLLLVMSEVDDADEVFLNSLPIGKTGEFPPNAKSELHSLRVYPVPRYLREDYNVLAIRVFDQSDSGGITGNIFRIIRADSLYTILNQIVDEPFRQPLLYTSNGIMVSAFNPAASKIEWVRPHVFEELETDLRTEAVASSITLDVETDDGTRTLDGLRCLGTGYDRNTSVLHSTYEEGLDVFWYHPHGTASRILVILARTRTQSPIRDIGIRFQLTKNYWTVEQREHTIGADRDRYFILSYHSCCEELSRRDMDQFLSEEAGHARPLYTLESEIAIWDSLRAPGMFLPASMTQAEKQIYRQSLSTLLSAQVRETGGGQGQIVSAFAPPSRAIAIPRDHLTAVIALAKAGLVDAARAGIDFIRNAETGGYALFSVYGIESGVGYPYLVTPAWYTGIGKEKTWARPDQAVLSFDGFPLFIEAIEALRIASKRQTESRGKTFRDSVFLSPLWRQLSSRVADVILYMRDSSGLMTNDAGPWGRGLSRKPNVYASLHAVAALRIAARYAFQMNDRTRSALYLRAAAQTLVTIERMIARVSRQSTAADLSANDLTVFHPLIIDGVTLGLFEPGSSEARFAFDVVEKSFQIEDVPDAYYAQPDGDWFARQARPQLSLRLSRAYAAGGNLPRAEKLFRDVTTLASANHDTLPELIDTITKNWYGGIPAVAAGAAEYILTAEVLAQLRMK